MTEDEMSMMLASIESLSATNAELKVRVSSLQRRGDILESVQRERNRLRDELKAAVAKVEEWFDYSQAWSPLIPRRRQKELKASVPKPLDTDTPF